MQHPVWDITCVGAGEGTHEYDDTRQWVRVACTNAEGRKH